jgi:hypothetical protein
MAKLTIELPYSYTEANITEWLESNKLTHLKTHRQYLIRTGDALKSSKGIIARVVWDGRNEVSEPYIVIANNKLSSDEMFTQFQPSLHVYEDDSIPTGCPNCGSYKGDAMECPECGLGL